MSKSDSMEQMSQEEVKLTGSLLDLACLGTVGRLAYEAIMVRFS